MVYNCSVVVNITQETARNQHQDTTAVVIIQTNNNEMQITKKVFMAHLKALWWYSPGETEENQKYQS